MAQFTDASGGEWVVRLTVGALADVREQAGVDLGQAIRSEGSLADLIFGDPAMLVRALWVLVESQAKAAGVDPVAFAHRFDGPTLERATEALLAAVADFFPRSKVGMMLRQNLTQAMSRLDDAIIQKLSSTSSGSAGTSPASSGSMPDR